MQFKSEFSADAWMGFAQMFTAAQGMVSKADGDVGVQETDLLFSVVEGEYAAVPGHVLDAFGADPALAREVLADTSTIVNRIAPDDGGAAATRAKDHLSEWLRMAPTEEI